MHLFSMQTFSEVQLYYPITSFQKGVYLLNNVARVLRLKYEEMLTYLTLPINIVNLVF